MTKEKKPVEYYLISVFFTILIVVCFLQVLFRFVLNLPLDWTEELSRYVFIILVYLGASAAAKDDRHVRIEVIDDKLSPKTKKKLDIFVRLLCGFSCLIITFNLRELVYNSGRANQKSAALRLPMAAIYVMVGIMFAVIAFRFFQRAVLIAKTDVEEIK